MRRKEERQLALLDSIRNYGRVSINVLENLAEGSRATFQRDLMELEQKQKIKRSYGEVVYSDYADEEYGQFGVQRSYMVTNNDVKRRIGAATQQIINDRDTIFITHGTTTCEVFNGLDRWKRLTVFTNSMEIVRRCSEFPNIDAYVIGGKCNYTTGQFEYIPILTSLLESINIKLLIMGSAAISTVNGVSFYDFASYQLLRAISERSEKIIVLADSSKFGRNALVDGISLERIDTIVTDSGLNDEYRKMLEMKGIRCILAQ